MSKTNKYIFLALLTSGALVLSVIESMIPLPIAVPGAKLGLSNMIILSTLIIFNYKSTLFVSVLRSFLLLMVVGNPISFIYSLFASVFSLTTMYIINKYFSKFFSLLGVSIFGALAHNFAQIAIACVILENVRMFTYLPIMSIFSLFTGYFVGYVSIYLIRNLKKQIYYSNRR